MWKSEEKINAEMILKSPSESPPVKYIDEKSTFMEPFKSSLVKYFLLSSNRRWLKLRVRKLTGTCKTLLVSFLLATVFLYLQLSSGIIERCFLEIDFREGFRRYPADLEDFSGTVKRYVSSLNRSSFQPPPINLNYTTIPFVENAPVVLSNTSSVGLLIVVKSATRNYKKRKAIRKTWGDPEYLRNTFLFPDLPTRVAFICGIPEECDDTCVGDLFTEEQKLGDIILASYTDSYGNNTFKTMLSMRWALEQVKSFKYLMIVDDDMYINPGNAISFIKNISRTNARLVTSEESGVQVLKLEGELKEGESLVSLDGAPLIMGQLCIDAQPFRSTFGFGSKWSMSIAEYPLNLFPPYAAGGSTLFDADTVTKLYYGSFFTQHFWIDDVFIGIVAHKLGLKLTHTQLIDSSYKGGLSRRLRSRMDKMIAIHGLDCPEQLVELWRTRDLESLTDCWYLRHNFLS